MSRERFRVLVFAAASLVSIIAALFVLDWFVARMAGAPMQIGEITIDLREVRACSPAGPCAVMALSGPYSAGTYPTLATVTFWAAIVFALILAFQTGTRVLSGYASAAVTRAGHGISLLVALTALAAAYLFGPELGSASAGGMSVSVDRGWGPLAMLLGLVLGNVALHYAAAEDSDLPHEVPLPFAAARHAGGTLPPPYVPLAERARGASSPPPLATARTATGDRAIPRPTVDRPSAPLATCPEHLKGKLQFATLAGEITRAGIDARREDGPLILALWRDVVGIVARRLPPPDGAPFVDIVSTAGSTLRILPWTRLTGDPITGDDEHARVRALVTLLAQRCPDAHLDAATRDYLAGTEPAPQLPDAATLAAHDQRLA